MYNLIIFCKFVLTLKLNTMTIENHISKEKKFIYVQQLNILNQIWFFGMTRESDVFKKDDYVIGVWKIKENTQN